MVPSDPVLDDPGELVRFWLWHRYHHAVQRFTQASLASALGLKAGAVGAWIDRHAVPTIYWNPIARYFERPNYRALEDEAMVLWASSTQRRGYVPLRTRQKKRGGEAGASPGARVGSATPGLIAGYLRETHAATARRPRPRAAQPGKGRRSRE